MQDTSYILIDGSNSNSDGYPGTRFFAFASELRLEPGNVPQSLRTTYGNRLPFDLVSATAEKFHYRQRLGCIDLIIFNT